MGKISNYLDKIRNIFEKKWIESTSQESLVVLLLGSYANEPKMILEELKKRIREWEPMHHQPFFLEDISAPDEKATTGADLIKKFVTCIEVADLAVVVLVPEVTSPTDTKEILKRGEYIESMCLVLSQYRDQTCLFYKDKDRLTSMHQFMLDLPCAACGEFSSVDDITKELKDVFLRFQRLKFLKAKGIAK